MQEHVKRLHEEELYKCDICEKIFADERYLKIHMDTYQAHRLLTSGLKAHKVVHASLGTRFGQQDLYFLALIEILMIYLFQYGSFGGGVAVYFAFHAKGSNLGKLGPK